MSQPIWKQEIDKINDCPQRQDSTADQMTDLFYVANKLGFYDAADFINDLISRRESIGTGGRYMSQPIWKQEINKINDCPQRQDSTADQMTDLFYVANKLGFYDAADFIKQAFMDNR